jgi:hypothetical protein
MFCEVVLGRYVSWRISWTTHVALCRPMSMRAWRAWLERFVGPLSPERLQITES